MTVENGNFPAIPVEQNDFPDQVEVMDPTPDETLTLISCYPYLVDTQRIVVKASLRKG